MLALLMSINHSFDATEKSVSAYGFSFCWFSGCVLFENLRNNRTQIEKFSWSAGSIGSSGCHISWHHRRLSDFNRDIRERLINSDSLPGNKIIHSRIRDNETAILHHTPLSEPLIHGICMESRISVEHTDMGRVLFFSDISEEDKDMISWESLDLYEFVTQPSIPGHRTINSPWTAIIFSVQSGMILFPGKRMHADFSVIILRISTDITPEDDSFSLFQCIQYGEEMFPGSQTKFFILRLIDDRSRKSVWGNDTCKGFFIHTIARIIILMRSDASDKTHFRISPDSFSILPYSRYSWPTRWNPFDQLIFGNEVSLHMRQNSRESRIFTWKCIFLDLCMMILIGHIISSMRDRNKTPEKNTWQKDFFHRTL